MPIVPNAFQHIPKKSAHMQNTYVHYLEETNKTQSGSQLSFLSIRHLICHFCLQHFSPVSFASSPSTVHIPLHNLAKTRISIVGFQTSEERLRNELKFSDKKKYLHARLCTYCANRNTQSHTQTQRILEHKSVKKARQKQK